MRLFAIAALILATSLAPVAAQQRSKGVVLLPREQYRALPALPRSHQMTISTSFAMGRYEVTQEEWQSVMGSNPREFNGLRTSPDGRAESGPKICDRVIRGGSYRDTPRYLNVFNRNRLTPVATVDHVGFQLARMLP